MRTEETKRLHETGNVLAADTINGVYVFDADALDSADDLLVGRDFINALKYVEEGEVIYGNVSDEEAEEIEREYGIR